MKTDEKTGIIYQRWKAPSPKAVLLLVHGLGAHTERWAFLADYFLNNNISAYAIGLRGFGETKGLKGHIDSFRIYLDDISHLRGIIRKENPGKRIFLVGESIGGLISFLMTILFPGFFDGLICISPAFASKLKFTSADYSKIFFSIFYNPKKQFKVPFNSGMCTRDPNYQKIMNGNSREHRFATSRFLVDTFFAQMYSKIFKHRIKIPVLFLLAGKDELVDPKTSRVIFRGLKVKDKAVIEYPDMHHALSIDLGKERVFGDIYKWMEKRI